MKKTFLLCALLSVLVGFAWAQASESFTNLPSTSSNNYLSRSWTGDDGVTWTAADARTDQTLNGKAICWGTSGTRNVISPSYPGGMGTLTFNYVRAFTGTNPRSLEVYVNGNQIGSTITVSPTSNTVVQYSNPVNVSGNVVLEIRSTGSAQVKVDDVAWTSYSGSNPTIGVSPPILTGFSYEYNSGPSTAQSFALTGSNLTADLAVAASTNYLISNSENGTYGTSLTYPPSNGSVSATVWVRLKSGLDIGTYDNENIVCSSTGATSQNVNCNGSVTSPPPPAPSTATDATNVANTSFTANWTAVTGATGYYLDVYTKTPGVNATDLFFSEYIEGGSNNKAIEIYNGTGAPVDLSAYKVLLYSNGATTPINPLSFPAGTMLAHNDVYVIANSQANAEILAEADVTSTVTYFNGDDAIALVKTVGDVDEYVDIFGVIGNDPDGSASITGSWTADGGYSTKDKTLVRKPSVTQGVSVNPPIPGAGDTTGFLTLATEWDVYDQDTTSYLGSHDSICNSTITYVTGFQNLDVGNVTSYNVTGLQPGTTYYYVVRAYNAYGTSANSNEISAQTEESATPVVLSSFTCTLTSDMYVNLKWVTQSETGMRGFYVLRGEQNSQQQAQIISPLIDATNQSQTQAYSYRDSESLIDGTTYYYWLSMVELDGSSTVHGPVTVFYQSVSTPPVIPTVTALNNVYPNPFNPVAFIPYSIEKGRTDQVRIHIYNSRGQIVRTLIDQPHSEGNYQLQWDGRDTNGNECATGVYFVRMIVGKDSFLRKAVLVK